MARLRMNNCGLNDHLYRYGLVDTPYGACGSRENTRHFLLYCPLFYQIRNETIGSQGYERHQERRQTTSAVPEEAF